MRQSVPEHGLYEVEFLELNTVGNHMKNILFASLFFLGFSCAPTVKVEAPDKPVEINLNVKIDHNIKVQVDKQLEKTIEENEEIF